MMTEKEPVRVLALVNGSWQFIDSVPDEPTKRKMTKGEFAAQFTARDLEWNHAHGLQIVPCCNCNYEKCQGWYWAAERGEE